MEDYLSCKDLGMLEWRHSEHQVLVNVLVAELDKMGVTTTGKGSRAPWAWTTHNLEATQRGKDERPFLDLPVVSGSACSSVLFPKDKWGTQR